MRQYPIILAAVAPCLATSGTRADEILNLGDPAPNLAVGRRAANFGYQPDPQADESH